MLGDGAVGVEHAWLELVSLGLEMGEKGGGEGGDVQKKRPFQTLRSSRLVKGRPLQR